MASATGPDNPFRDVSDSLVAPVAPSQSPPPSHSSEPAWETTSVADTLNVGSTASLTLGTDSLVVLDETRVDNKSTCCSLSLAGKNKSTRSIPFYNILWAEHAEDGHIVIEYAQTISKTSVRPAVISYPLDKPGSAVAAAWIEKLLDRAYGASQRNKRIKVLINPFGGPGGAEKTYYKQIAPIFTSARCELSVEKTQYNGHAVEIGQNLDIDTYDVVACCSGDGVPHEVWNGLGKRQDAALALYKTAVVQLPCGSGNALSWNFNGTNDASAAALAVVKGLRTPLDLASITQGNQRILSFLSQTLGTIAEADLSTEHLRWMGSHRFTWGILTRLLTKKTYPADIAIKVEHATKPSIRAFYRAEAAKASPTTDARPLPPPTQGLPPLKYGTTNDPLPSSWSLLTPHPSLGNFYAGNIAYMSANANFFPASLPADGCLDLVRIRGDIPRLRALKAFQAVEDGTIFDMDDVDYQKISAYRILPKQQHGGDISVDGERVPFEGFQVEVHRGLGTTLSKSGHLCEARGV
ncbi:sphingoid long chain base kinase 4 [Pyrenophora tritici-repentis Pt-1C-BFP]|uniref:Sphingoid long chain base kinase 4 n=1 Tax=Pyrenophora tritici-repentis (strain Pt-1C-BFP) TaxID=426418 RepID=B2WNE1_PYRTR|nr:sphingoid long chain base kinase 4 [Pyrenophora tritici-repentis Pt-1C-BFP]EDU44448.1 sphingoid long chain base kinase 4 [Pyrenophora tritici-repentis Pt-1C-BFP]